MNELNRAIRAALGIGITGLTLASGDIAAQEDTEVLERVEVVGSRIKQAEAETNQPIFTLEREDIQAQGLTTIGDVLQNIASGGSAALNAQFNNGGNGESQIDLRNIGPNRTLVLVNGRRWVGGTGLGGVVDLNTIPTAAVERIEVLKDGASAIYGSDAIAGVVNVILRSDYEGADAHAYWGEYTEGDGRRQAYDFTLGLNGDRDNVMISAAYVKEDPVMAGDRSISRVPTYGTDNLLGSSTTPRGRFRTDNGTWFIRDTLTTTDPGGIPGLDEFRPYAATDAYNFAPENYLITPQERTSIFMRGHYDVLENVRFVGQAVYNERISEQLLASMPVVLGNGPSAPARAIGIVVSEGNLYNPFGADVLGVQRRVTETGGRSFNQDVNTFAFTGAFEGDFMLGDRFWGWDAGYTYGENDQLNHTFGLFDLSRIEQAVGPSYFDSQDIARCGTQDATIAGCVPLNLFGGVGTITPEMLDYVSFTAHDSLGFKMTNYFANVSGELFNLPGGMVAFAAGYEYRRESGYFQPDAIISTGNTTGNAATPTSGKYSVDEFYAELALPLLSDVALARELELKVAGRYSDYSSFGDTTNFTAGLKWRPLDDLMFRGNYGEGFRAPSISELFTGAADSFPTLLDPCANAPSNRYTTLTPEQQARCHAAGVPIGGYDQGNTQIRITIGGNPNLTPETSTTKTLGFVYSPGWLEGFDVSLDWWNVELDNTIIAIGGQFVANACIQAGQPAFCNLITRGPNGNITGLLASVANTGELALEGWDLTLRYAIDTDWGRFGATWDTTYYAKNDITVPTGEFDEAGNPVFDTIEQVGELTAATFPSAIWRLRSNANIRWNLGDFGVNWGIRYFHHVTESCADFEGFDPVISQCSDPDRYIADPDNPGQSLYAGENKLGSTTYHDVRFNWQSPWNANIAVGVNNLFEKDPPISFTSFANSQIQDYEIQGRFWYAEYTQRF
jgi:iron complex outermembrane receptor protein